MHMPQPSGAVPILSGSPERAAAALWQSLQPERWPLPLAELPAGTALVGGAVRDGLLGRLAERPDLDLFAPDREHPSIHGTYLETCVVYATVMRSSPVPLRYVAPGISESDASYLRRVAWETFQAWTP